LPTTVSVGFALDGPLPVSVLRSAVIGDNDFGDRAVLVPSLFLLLLAAQWLHGSEAKPFAGLVWTVQSVELDGTGFQAVLLREYAPLDAAANSKEVISIRKYAFETRWAHAQAARSVPVVALIQLNPIDPGSYFTVAKMLYSERAMASDAATDCGAVLGTDQSVRSQTPQSIEALYLAPGL
jgi:hypothetical protein